MTSEIYVVFKLSLDVGMSFGIRKWVISGVSFGEEP